MQSICCRDQIAKLKYVIHQEMLLCLVFLFPCLSYAIDIMLMAMNKRIAIFTRNHSQRTDPMKILTEIHATRKRIARKRRGNSSIIDIGKQKSTLS
jgi:hypothetical protein